MKIRKKTVKRQLSSLTAFLMIVQTLLTFALFLIGGIFEQIRDNAYDTFGKMVNNRAMYLQSDMINTWSNLDMFISQVSSNLYLLDSSAKLPSENNEFFLRVSPILQDMLRNSKTTDSFIILTNSTPVNDCYSALYLRDEDPLNNSEDGKDICLLSGPSKLLSRYSTLENLWNYSLKLDDTKDFLEKPCNAYKNGTPANLSAYWCPPFSLYENDEPRITYSCPLIDEKGTLYGIIGIGISAEYLKTHIPSSDFANKDSLGYFLAKSNGPDSPLEPIFLTGEYQRRNINQELPLKLDYKDKKNQISLVTEHPGKKTIYACTKGLQLYAHNTPFEAECWYLVGLKERSQLLSLSHNIATIFCIVLVCAIVFGIISGSLIAALVLKPLLSLSEKVKVLDPLANMNLERTGYEELDELTNAINAGNQSIAEKARRLQKERDYDSLTDLCGRHFFRTRVEELLQLPDIGVSALVMLDIDDFKSINDTYGHAFGDTYLQKTAEKLKEPGSTGYLAGRRSGDEFFIFFYDFTSRKEVLDSLDKLYRDFERNLLIFPDGSKQKIHISAGIAWREDSALDYDTLLAKADEALYRRKKSNKGFYGE